MAVDLSGYGFSCDLAEMGEADRAVLAALVSGSDEQRAAVAGPRASAHSELVERVRAFVSGLDIDEPDEGFTSSIERARFLATHAEVAVADAFPFLHSEVLRFAGHRYAFLNR